MKVMELLFQQLLAAPAEVRLRLQAVRNQSKRVHCSAAIPLFLGKFVLMLKMSHPRQPLQGTWASEVANSLKSWASIMSTPTCRHLVWSR